MPFCDPLFSSGLKKTRGRPRVFFKRGINQANQIDALSLAPGLNFTDLEALILIFSPVWGLIPLRAARLPRKRYRNQ